MMMDFSRDFGNLKVTENSSFVVVTHDIWIPDSGKGLILPGDSRFETIAKNITGETLLIRRL